MDRASYILPLTHALRLYQVYSPVRRGRYRIADLIDRLSRRLPQETSVEVQTLDGLKFRINPAEIQYRQLYLFGSYDRSETQVLRRILRPGDVALDIGANFGYYTLLFAYLVGQGGAVHSFEPVPSNFERLRTNCALNAFQVLPFLNNCAIGDREGTVPLHVFRRRACGDASLSNLGFEDYDIIECPIQTVDAYLAARQIERVTLIKCDVEGAEKLVLEGSKRLLRSAAPPMLLLEVNRFTCRAFGYDSQELLDFLQDAADYRFFHVERLRPGHLRPMARAHELNGLENVLCIVPEHHTARLDRLR